MFSQDLRLWFRVLDGEYNLACKPTWHRVVGSLQFGVSEPLDCRVYDLCGPSAVGGQSQDSSTFIADMAGRRLLFNGYIVFYGGTRGLINTPDSGMEGYRSDLVKLSRLAVDSIFPGHGLPEHGVFTLRDSQRQIKRAEQVGRNFLPRQIGQGDLIVS